MNKTIYKYPLDVTDVQEIKLPVGAEILTVQAQNGTLCLWALVDPQGIEKETYNFTPCKRRQTPTTLPTLSILNSERQQTHKLSLLAAMAEAIV